MQPSSGMLSAKELSLIRQSKAHPRPLPPVPPKDFVPTGSEEEAAAIEGIIQSKIQFLKDERAERKNLLVTAEWLHDKGLARVTKKVGGEWTTYGFEENGCTFIYPEEALFLLENSKLELYYDGTPISIQQAYQLLLKDKYCLTDNYIVYSHLNRLGYRLRRQIPSTKSKMRRTDTVEDGSVTKKVKLDSSTTFLLPATNSEEDPEYILNFGDNSAQKIVDIPFPPADLLPESIRDRKGSISYLVVPRSSSFVVEDVQHDLSLADTSHSTPSISTARNWAEYKAAELAVGSKAQVDYSDNPLYQGQTKPLIPANFKGNLMDRLRMLSFSPLTEFDPSDEAGLPIAYEVYSPSRPFRKSNPGNPCYSLAITSWDMPFPSPAQQERLKCEANDRGSMVLIAVVGKGSGVSFYQIVPIISPLSV